MNTIKGLLAFLMALFVNCSFAASSSDDIFTPSLFTPEVLLGDSLNHDYPPMFLSPQQRDYVDRIRLSHVAPEVSPKLSTTKSRPNARYRVIGFVMTPENVFVALDKKGILSISQLYPNKKLLVKQAHYASISLLVDGVPKYIQVGDYMRVPALQ